jgi:hypothetical protein
VLPPLSFVFSCRSVAAAKLLMAAGRGLEQRPGVRVFRIGEHVSGRALLDDDPLLHHRKPVADLRGDAQIMGDEQHGEIELPPHLVEQF